jgi:hypothetical protein
MRLLFIPGIVCLTVFSCEAANPPNLPMVAAKAAAAVKRVIPGSEGEAQGPLAVVKKRTRRIPRQDTLGRMDVPDSYGVMFIIRLQHGPYTGPPLPKAPQFDLRSESPATLARQNRQQDAYLRLQGCIRTTTMEEFHNSKTVMLVEILFGDHADKHMLEQAYAELTRSVAAELEH